MSDYDLEKREDWEKMDELSGMEAWRKIAPDEMILYLKAAKTANIKIEFTETVTDKLCVWCPPDQDMEFFLDELEKLEKQRG